MMGYGDEERTRDLKIMESIFQVQINLEVIIQMMLIKGICTKKEIENYRERVLELPAYRDRMEELEEARNGVEQYNSFESMLLKRFSNFKNRDNE